MVLNPAYVQAVNTVAFFVVFALGYVAVNVLFVHKALQSLPPVNQAATLGDICHAWLASFLFKPAPPAVHVSVFLALYCGIEPSVFLIKLLNLLQMLKVLTTYRHLLRCWFFIAWLTIMLWQIYLHLFW